MKGLKNQDGLEIIYQLDFQKDWGFFWGGRVGWVFGVKPKTFVRGV